jgi:hypothetical protein
MASARSFARARRIAFWFRDKFVSIFIRDQSKDIRWQILIVGISGFSGDPETYCLEAIE